MLFGINVKAQQIKSDSLQQLIAGTIDRIYRPLLFTTNPSANLLPQEKDAVIKYGEAGEQVIWNLNALKHYLNFQASKSAKDLENWTVLKIKINNKYPLISDAFDSNNDAWLLFENSNNRNYLQEALKWSKRAITLEPKSGNWKDTYANLLHKLGRTKEAIIIEEEALLLEPGNEDIKSNLKKMKANLSTWPVGE